MTDHKAESLIQDWQQSQAQHRLSCYVEIKHLEQAQKLWHETTRAVANDRQPPVIAYKGRNWWVTSYEVRGPKVRLRLHEAIEVVYVQGGNNA